MPEAWNKYTVLNNAVEETEAYAELLTPEDRPAPFDDEMQPLIRGTWANTAKHSISLPTIRTWIKDIFGASKFYKHMISSVVQRDLVVAAIRSKFPDQVRPSERGIALPAIQISVETCVAYQYIAILPSGWVASLARPQRAMRACDKQSRCCLRPPTLTSAR